MEVLGDFFWKFLQLFLNAVIPPLIVILAGFLVALAKKLIGKLTASMNLDVLAIMQEAARSAVLAAEQVNLVQLAIDKKEYALQQASEYLASKNIKFDLGELSDLIEAAVMDEFNRPRAEEARTSDFSEVITGDAIIAPPSADEIATAVADKLQSQGIA